MRSDFFELLEFSAQNLDQEGRSVLDNEELLLDLMRGDLGSPRICGLVGGFWQKNRVPVYRPVGRWGAIYVLPSHFHYMRFFDGKPREMLFDGKTEGQDRWVRRREP